VNAPDPTEIPGEEGEPEAEPAAVGGGDEPLLDYLIGP
jgi:hypothetical protein